MVGCVGSASRRRAQADPTVRTIGTRIRRIRPLTPLVIASAVVAAGARAAPVEVYAAGDIADCRKVAASESMARRTARLIPGGSIVLVLGDTVYRHATAANYASCYEPTWGVHRPKTLAVPGNHDYVEGRIDDFLDYFPGRPGPHAWFAQRLGAWLVIGLDSHLSDTGPDQQYAWLERTLDANRDARCTLAMWHEPLFSSGLRNGPGTHMRRFWGLLDRRGAELVLNGHEHFYEAFDPLDAEGRPVPDGLREFIVGTGGARLYRLGRTAVASRVRVQQHGVLRLTLDESGYAWEFIGVDGGIADRGAAQCR